MKLDEIPPDWLNRSNEDWAEIGLELVKYYDQFPPPKQVAEQLTALGTLLLKTIQDQGLKINQETLQCVHSIVNAVFGFGFDMGWQRRGVHEAEQKN